MLLPTVSSTASPSTASPSTELPLTKSPATGSLCAHCRTLPVLKDAGSTLHLTHPLAHTRAKLRGELARHYSVGVATPESLAVVVPPGALAEVTARLESLLSVAERESCKVLQLAEGEHIALDKLAQVQPLSAFVAKTRSHWLVDMLGEEGFYADFQPIVAAAKPEVAFAYECLLRGRDANGATVYPDRIFTAAREADLLFQTDRAARLTAIRDATRHGLQTPIFINFNPTSIYDPSFCLKTTIAAIQDAGISPDRIVFEVVESDEVNDPSHLLNIVQHYRRQGFRIALDDLGAGYGSLNLLAQLKPDFVKFDRELVSGIDHDPYKQKVFGKLVEMAHDLNIQTLAEGVETFEEYRWLLGTGVDYLQGYFFARPASPPPAPQPALEAIPPVVKTSLPTPLLDIDFSVDSAALQGVLDSLGAQVAVIDSSGKILMVNRAWRAVGVSESGQARFTGGNYLDVCRAASKSEDCAEDAAQSYQGIRAVLAGDVPSFSREYACVTPQGRHWFIMNVTPFSQGRGGAVISHLDITERKVREAEIEHLARHDQLTGAANRRYFYEEMRRAFAEAERELVPFSLLYLDLDGFKGVNDRLGHACGDELLERVAGRLQALLRDGDLLARFGGDEFVMLLRGVSSAEVAAATRRFAAALDAPFVLHGESVACGGSLGAACYPEHGHSAEALLRHADSAMYRVKTGQAVTALSSV